MPNNGELPARSELREFLSARLPDYMVPALFVRLSALPLTPNGKVDRAALPPVERAETVRDESFTTPGSETEKAVAAILAPLLGIQEVDVNANFFSLGGHSLLGTQLIARLRDAFGVEMALRAMVRNAKSAPSVTLLKQRWAEVRMAALVRLEWQRDVSVCPGSRAPSAGGRQTGSAEEAQNPATLRRLRR